MDTYQHKVSLILIFKGSYAIYGELNINGAKMLVSGWFYFNGVSLQFERAGVNPSLEMENPMHVSNMYNIF